MPRHMESLVDMLKPLS
uniref:Uncharacterized protein n=1 Tax=Arundo donax TaxID=35708 RepID=A0A0A9B8Z0_ARUDO